MFPRFHFVAQMWGEPRTGTKDFEGTFGGVHSQISSAPVVTILLKEQKPKALGTNFL